MKWSGTMTPIEIAGAGAAAFFLMDFAVRFGGEARRLDAAPSDRGTTRGTYLALVAILLAVFVLPHILPPGASPRWAPAIDWCGAALVPVGFAIRLWATLTLRHAYTRTLRIQPGQELMRRGPYRWVRHPGYLGSLMLWGGAALASGSPVAMAIAAVALGIAYGRRIRHEEAMLTEAFGERYLAYRREVGALIPRPARRERRAR